MPKREAAIPFQCLTQDMYTLFFPQSHGLIRDSIFWYSTDCRQSCFSSWTEYGLACMRNVSTYDRNWFLKRIQFILCPQNSRYLPPRMELLWRLLLLHKCRMLFLADRRSKLLNHEFKFGDSAQPRGKCLYSTPSQWRQILDWTQWPKRGGLVCVDKQRDK